MSIQFSCPACGHLTQVDDQFAGQSGPCAQCKQQVTIPTVEQAMAVGNYKTAEQTPQPIGEYRDNQGSWVTCLVIAVVVVVLIVGLLAAMLIPAVGAAREAARRMQCSNNMKQFGIAMHNYHDVYKKFPCSSLEDENGQGFSWRVAVLPFMEQQNIYDQFRFDEPWDSDHNLSVAEHVSPAFQCLSDEPEYKTIRGHKIPVTNYVMIVGELPGDEGRKPVSAISSGPNVYSKFSDIIDGTSNTLMLVEVTGDDRPAWCEPLDIDAQTFLRGINAGPGTARSEHPSGINVLYCDGSVHFFPDTIDPDTLKAMTTRNGGEAISY